MALTANGLGGLAGVHGYARPYTVSVIPDEEDYVPGTLFYSELQSAGIIDSRDFSIFMGDTDEESFIEIGGSNFAKNSIDSTDTLSLPA